jgi:hypothetical protein
MHLLGKEFNPFTGVTEEYYSNGGILIEKSTANLSKLVERNRAAQNSGNNGFTKSKNMRHIGDIDCVTQMKMLKDGINIGRWNEDDRKAVVKWLRDRDNAFFRICSGKF